MYRSRAQLSQLPVFLLLHRLRIQNQIHLPLPLLLPLQEVPQLWNQILALLTWQAPQIRVQALQ